MEFSASKPFTDEEFPPGQISLNAENKPEFKNYSWKRVSELIEKPILFNDELAPII